MLTVACPICGFNDKTAVEDERLSIYRCGGCTHMFTVVGRQGRERYDENYFFKTHKNWFDNPDYRFFDFIWSQILNVRKDLERVRIFDAGCGREDFLRHICKKDPGISLTGIDLSDNKHDRINFIRGDVIKEKIDDTFSVISSLMVIEHVEDPCLFVQKIGNMLEAKGTVIISTINNDSLAYTVARFLKRIGMRKAYDRLYSIHHLQHYSNKSLRALMEKNDFNILSCINHNYPFKAVDFPPANLLVKTLYKVSIFFVFAISDLLGSGVQQTMVCAKKR